MLDLRNVSKRYGSVLALQGMNLNLKAGVILGLLGPNGAGKTTTIKVTLGLLKPDQGTVAIMGQNPMIDSSVLKRVGYIGDYDALYPTLTGRELLAFVTGLHGMNDSVARGRINYYLERIGLEKIADRLIRTYSSGNVRKLAVVCGLIHEPDLVLADEPTVHLDPPSVTTVYELFNEVRNRGGSVLLSTHVLPTVRAICQQAVFLERGTLTRPAFLVPEYSDEELELLYKEKAGVEG